MKRREFLAACGAGVLGPAVAKATQDDPARDVTGFGPLRVRLEAGGFVTVMAFQIHGPDGVWGRSWVGDLQHYREDRFDLGVGGGLLRRPFRARWAEAVPFGRVLLQGTTLIGETHMAGAGGRRVTVGAGDQSWDLPRILAPFAPLPVSGPAVGAMRLAGDGRLLVSLAGRPAL